MAFYRDVLGLPASLEGERAEITAGETRVAFLAGAGEPVAHFAFNVPAGGLERAIAALDDDVRWLADPAGHTRHRFPAWRAEAVYLLDPAGHVVELIAREEIGAAGARGAGPARVLGVSELGVSVPDVPASRQSLEQATGLSAYGSPSEQFAAIGDARGLLILVERGRPWFPERETPAEPTPARAWLEAPRSTIWTDPSGRMELHAGPDAGAP